MVATPGPEDVTVPDVGFTTAMPGVPPLQVPPAIASDNTMLLPAQTESTPAIATGIA